MRPYFSPLLAFLAFSSTLLPQEPAPICGLPHIARISPDAPVSLQKAVGVLTGDRRFSIREDVTSTTAGFIEVDFYLKYSDTDFEVYVEVAEWDSGHVDAIAVATLAAAFGDHTFEGSIDSSRGIQAIAEDVFGPPPDIDNNGKVYILLINVRDDYVPDSSDTYMAGYFDPLDQTWSGNLADIIYLDTYPGRLSGANIRHQISTLAHEYQHLIHYGRDKNEKIWVNEGLSELSPTLMGLPHREFTHYMTDTNMRLDSFDGELADYARCGLFFLYTWVQLGTQFIKDLIDNTENGTSGFNQTLSRYSQPSIDEFVLDWHLANFVQGEGAYGYGDLFSVPQPVMHDVITTFPQDDIGGSVVRLGARWTLITGGQNLYLFASRSGDDPTLTLLNGDDRTLIAAPQLFTAGFQDYTFGTAYSDLVVLATSSTAVMDSVSYGLFVNAEGGFEELTLSYDGNEQPGELLFISLGDTLGNAGEAAVVFDIPGDAGELSAVQFYTLTSDSLRVRVYRQDLVPDSVIYSALVSAPLGDAWTTHRLPQNLKAGNQGVYVSVASVDNALAYNENDTTSHYSYYRFPDSTSFFRLDELKVEFPDGDSKILVGNWSIRLSYLMPDTSEDVVDIPLAVGYFYPNPFIIERSARPVAKLEISPGKPVEVYLYNILGQEIWKQSRPAYMISPIVWQGLMTNGRLAPSGVYLARISVSDSVFSRKLVLIR